MPGKRSGEKKTPSSARRYGNQKRRPGGRRFNAAYWPMCCFNQAFTVSCHNTLLAGFSTQWFSSGK